MSNSIKIGDLVVQRYVHYQNVGIVLMVSWGRSETPKNEPDIFYEYAWVQWLGGTTRATKTSLLEKIS